MDRIPFDEQAFRNGDVAITRSNLELRYAGEDDQYIRTSVPGIEINKY